MEMTWMEFASYAVFLGMGLVVALIVFLLVVGPMRKLLKANSRTKQARSFFIRTLFIILILAAITPIVGKNLGYCEDKAFMEHVWRAAGDLEDSLIYIGLYLFGFVVLMTVMAAALGRIRDE